METGINNVVRKFLVGVLCLAIPVVTGADLFNTASVTYRDPVGVVHTDLSNTVVVAVSASAPPSALSDPDLSSINGKTYTSRDTISLTYKDNAVSFNWEFTWLRNTPAAPHSTSVLGNKASVFPVSTPAPHVPLATLNLPTGSYELRVQAVNSAGTSGWATALITLVSSDLSNARVFPNPWRGARGDGSILFDQMPANCAVTIFTVSGREVKTLSAPGGSVPWDLTNASGDKVASGLYLYLITDDLGNKTRGKLAIIR